MIMIVDDDEDDIEIFCEAVKQLHKDNECVSASNGEDALHKLSRENERLPDFIFLDLNMPRLNGKQCLTRLKLNTRLRDIPVIIYSTSKLEEDIEEAKQLGAVHFLTKPSKIKDLQNAIALILAG